jgi:hypothetical protein
LAEQAKAWNEANRERVSEHDKRRRRKSRTKLHAWWAIQDAVRRGHVQKPEHCSNCGTACSPDAHHADYEKPLEVEWLCRPCHLAAHGKRVRMVTA